MTTLTGVGRLVLHILRRDRLRLVLWVVGLAGVTMASAGSLPNLYSSDLAIQGYVRTAGDNPAMVAFAGPGHGFDHPNIGVILVNEVQLFSQIGLALMSIFLVNRNTRAEEDSEHAELIRSSVVGRHAPVAAAAIVIAGANAAIGILLLLGFVAFGYPLAGSVALALSIAAVGLVFAGIAAIVAQVMSSGRATLGVSTAILGVAFVVRAVGDIAENGLSWLSPIGWGQAVRAYAGEAWWALGVCLLGALAFVVIAFMLSIRRDLGSGLLPQRPGPPHAAASLRSPLGLALRLQRGPLLGWIVGLFVLGFVYGSVGQDIEQMIEENPALADFMAAIGGASITDAFFASAASLLAMTALGFTISSALRLRSEESTGLAEVVLATPTSRWTWALSHLGITVVGSILVMASAGLAMGASYAMVTGDSSQVLRMLGAALAPLPAVLLVLGLVVAIMGFAPRFSNAAWGVLAVSFVLSYLGELLDLPQWLRDVSPLDHVPAVPAEDLTLLPMALLSTLAVVLFTAGLVGLRRRDLHPW